MDSPYRSPEPLAHWLDAVTLPAGGSLLQGASREHRADGHDDWEVDPAVSERTWDGTGQWEPLHGGPVRASRRLIGGCIETRLAGWFDHANAVLIGRTSAPDEAGFTQRDAVVSALGDLGVPVVLDVDCGHVPPHLALVSGALAEVVVNGDVQKLRQTLSRRMVGKRPFLLLSGGAH